MKRIATHPRHFSSQVSPGTKERKAQRQGRIKPEVEDRGNLERGHQKYERK